jgi:hypothetical protein
MSKNKNVDYTQYVHEYTDEDGVQRYAVGEWDQEKGQYICPLDKRTAELSGCSREYSRTPAGLGGYKSRQKALRRARYLFQEDPILKEWL